jgi:type I restriction-modification system DNA methylase subunit
MNKYAKDFIKILKNISPAKHEHEVFSDWLILASAALYSWKRDKSVEEEYLEVSKNYTPGKLEKHAHLLYITVEALEDSGTDGSDFLGEVFTVGELANSSRGQFFTPYHISRMMAEMSIGKSELPKGRVCKISDPCCGAGGMLIAGAMVMKNRGFDYQRDALFFGKDIDHRCARMAFIQLSLIGAPAVIVCGDSLLMTCYWQRETIGYHMSGMDHRLRIETLLEGVQKLEPAVPVLETTVPALPAQKELAAINFHPSREYIQGELF